MPSRQRPRIAIIGAGFGGLAAAIELKKAGYDDVVIFERGDDVGGVWRENTYPGAACDVPSPLYSFSFEPNRAWPRRYSPQHAILDYLRQSANKYAVTPHIRFNTEILSAEFDSALNRWLLTTGDRGIAHADVVISAVGQLSRPAWPDIDGRDSFGGIAFHSAQWQHSVDLEGKRVAVIGTGASAVQFVPEIQPRVQRLVLFQRSAPYLLPRLDTLFADWQQTVLGVLPFIQKVERAAWWVLGELVGTAFLKSKLLSRAVEGTSRWHMQRQLDGSDLMDVLWPHYPIGCKRVLFSSNYLPAVRQPNVDVVTDRIVEITPTGIRTHDGTLHEVDVIIYGTGFKATDFLAPMTVTGPAGRDLHQQWTDGASAYLGIAIPGYPNLFLMYGPNTNLGSGSIVYMHECQARYIRQAIDTLRPGAAVVVRDDIADGYDTHIQASTQDGVWSHCSNWYRTASGRVVANWPGTQAAYHRQTRTFDARDYQRLHLTSPRP